MNHDERGVSDIVQDVGSDCYYENAHDTIRMAGRVATSSNAYNGDYYVRMTTTEDHHDQQQQQRTPQHDDFDKDMEEEVDEPTYECCPCSTCCCEATTCINCLNTAACHDAFGQCLVILCTCLGHICWAICCGGAGAY